MKKEYRNILAASALVLLVAPTPIWLAATVGVAWFLSTFLPFKV